MNITAAMVKDLREQTGAGILDCRNMLVETNGDFDAAVERLREKGLASAAKKVGREANEGLVGTYVHPGSRMAAMIEVNCETDFVARTSDFQEFVHDMAMQVAASRPRWVSIEDVPEDVVAATKAEYRQEMLAEGKPERILDRIVEGKMRKFYEDTCLLEQPFIKDGDRVIADLVKEKIAALGENIILRRFARLEIAG